MPLTVLDCTLRDGGYYNDWDFSPTVVENYLTAMATSGIDAVEIGFRFAPRDKFWGAHAYTSDDYLDTLDLPDHLQMGVMANAGDLVSHPNGPQAAVDGMFSPASNSKLSLVRIAAHFREVEKCRPGIERLKELGYEIGFNLMQVGGRKASELTDIATEVSSWNTVDVLYFADSLGNMEASDVSNAVAAFQGGWSGPIGIHAHDNMGRALTNTMAAIESEATWVDATVCGMGRGPGNLRMEYLLLDLARNNPEKYNPNALFPIVLGDFHDLAEKYNWGPNLFYFLSAAYGIHPTYVQEMLRVENYNPDHAISAIEQLGKNDSTSFTLERLQEAMPSNQISFPGTWSATGWAKDRTVLLVGSGPWVQQNLDMVVNYIVKTKPIVISLNTNSSIPENLIDAFAACHELRFAMESDHYNKLTSPLIVPIEAFTSDLKASIHSESIFDYGMSVSHDSFEAGETECIIPNRLAAAYGLAVATAAGAKEILLAGFDGYEAGNPLHEEMEHVFEQYRAASNTVPVISVTPTTYSVNQSSIFAPRTENS